MRTVLRNLLAGVLLAVLLAPAGGLLAAGLLPGGEQHACACGKSKGCCCQLAAPKRAPGAKAGGAHCELTPGERRCSLSPLRPVTPPERVVLSLDLRVLQQSTLAEGFAPWALADAGAVTALAAARPHGFADPPDPPPPRS